MALRGSISSPLRGSISSPSLKKNMDLCHGLMLCFTWIPRFDQYMEPCNGHEFCPLGWPRWAGLVGLVSGSGHGVHAGQFGRARDLCVPSPGQGK